MLVSVNMLTVIDAKFLFNNLPGYGETERKSHDLVIKQL